MEAARRLPRRAGATNRYLALYLSPSTRAIILRRSRVSDLTWRTWEEAHGWQSPFSRECRSWVCPFIGYYRNLCGARIATRPIHISRHSWRSGGQITLVHWTANVVRIVSKIVDRDHTDRSHTRNTQPVKVNLDCDDVMLANGVVPIH